MPRLIPALLLLVGCTRLFSESTSEEDKALNNFAEARQRAATYYDGGDYVRAALQYAKALEYRPDHLPSRLGLAYSLMYTNQPSNLVQAVQEFDKIGRQRDPAKEVKRIYGLGLTHRSLAVHFDRRSRIREGEGRLDLATKDRQEARDHARTSLGLMEQVLGIDDELAAREIMAPQRVSASLKPDAHIAMAHCEILLTDADNLEHLDRAQEHIRTFAEMAANARRFWEQRRQQVLVTDPMHDEGPPGAQSIGAEQRERYEMRIVGTIKQEVSVRKALVLTHLYLNRYREAINEATRILNLDPTEDEIFLLRGNAYAFLEPPDYRAAIKDLKEYRSRKGVDRLTDELVAINRRILSYERKLEEQERAGG